MEAFLVVKTNLLLLIYNLSKVFTDKISTKGISY